MAVLMCLLKSLSAVTLHGRNLSCLNLEEAYWISTTFKSKIFLQVTTISNTINSTVNLYFLFTSVAEIQNPCIRDSIGMSTVRPDKFSTVIIVQNSVLRIINFEMVRNFFRNFLQAEKSSLSVINMTLSENCFTGALCSVQESIMKLHQKIL